MAYNTYKCHKFLLIIFDALEREDTYSHCSREWTQGIITVSLQQQSPRVFHVPCSRPGMYACV